MRIQEPSGAVTILHWTLRQGSDALTCQVNATSEHAFAVLVRSHRRDTPWVTEHYSSVLRAMRRHAEIVGMLRASGWNGTEYCGPHPTRATAA